MARRCKRRRAAVFNGGGVAPVVVGECGWVLQLEGDQGVRRRRSIEEQSSSEGAHWKGVDSGDARTESSVGEGLRLGEAGEADAWAVGDESAVLERGWTRRTSRAGGESVGGSLLKGAAGDSRERGVRQQVRHVARGRRPDCVPADHGPAAACAGGAPLFQQWHTNAADARAPAGSGRGRRRERCGRRVGQPGRRNGVGRARINSDIFDLFKSISN
jgi:hypothetical protein